MILCVFLRKNMYLGLNYDSVYLVRFSLHDHLCVCVSDGCQAVKTRFECVVVVFVVAVVYINFVWFPVNYTDPCRQYWHNSRVSFSVLKRIDKVFKKSCMRVCVFFKYKQLFRHFAREIRRGTSRAVFDI